MGRTVEVDVVEGGDCCEAERVAGAPLSVGPTDEVDAGCCRAREFASSATKTPVADVKASAVVFSSRLMNAGSRTLCSRRDRTLV